MGFLLQRTILRALLTKSKIFLLQSNIYLQKPDLKPLNEVSSLNIPQ